MTHRYPLTLLPGIVGLIVGVIVATAWPGDSDLVAAYRSLPEFEVWRVVMMIQFAVYTTVLVYLWIGASELPMPRLPTRDGWVVGIFTVLVVLLPMFMFNSEPFPLRAHEKRLFLVVTFGLGAILLLTNRLARIHRAFGEAATVESHVHLRHAAEELLTIAAVVVTLATLGSAVLQKSLEALDAACKYYDAPLQVEHVVAYGAYFTLILFLFFAPLLAADRASAVRIRTGLADRGSSDDDDREADLGLDASLTEKIGSMFGVLSPLLGALVAQLVP
jgi:hypothetical protein